MFENLKFNFFKINFVDSATSSDLLDLLNLTDREFVLNKKKALYFASMSNAIHLLGMP